MANYNKVILMGNLTRDVELRVTPNNHPVANFGIATNRRYKDRDGNLQEETTFVDCEAWGRTAEVMNEYLAKGRPVFIEGRLKLNQWQDDQGNNRSKLRVVVENFQFVDSKGDSGSGGGSRGSGSSAASGSQDPVHQPITDDDIPF